MFQINKLDGPPSPNFPPRLAELRREWIQPYAGASCACVTARKREETLLDIPQEIQAISQQEMERHRRSGASGIGTDVSDESAVATVLEGCQRKFGIPHGRVNCAGHWSWQLPAHS